MPLLLGEGVTVSKTTKFAILKPPASGSGGGNDDFDLFGDDDEELGAGEEGMSAFAKKAAAAKAAKEKEIASKKRIEKSLVALEVKPWEADTDLTALWKKIIATQQEGLSWGENMELEEVAYGIKKIIMTCTVVDDLVSADDITEKIEAFEEEVQSVNMLSMNKIA
jgi:translation elongation factor EF-1beta